MPFWYVLKRADLCDCWDEARQSLITLFETFQIERNPYRITGTETALLLSFVAFAANEFTQWADAGTLFYASDIWSWLDMSVILIGLVFLICRKCPISLQWNFANNAGPQVSLDWLRMMMKLLIGHLISYPSRHWFLFQGGSVILMIEYSC